MVVNAAILLMFCYLLYQDLKHRAIYWVCFPVLTVLLTFVAIRNSNISSVAQNILYNSCFVTVQLLFLTAYFSIKQKRLVNITSSLLGLGDILFLFTVAFYFSPVNFLIFYLSSLLAVLLLAFLYSVICTEPVAKVPLAGLQALVCVFFFIADWLIEGISFLNDDWLTGMFYEVKGII